MMCLKRAVCSEHSADCIHSTVMSVAHVFPVSDIADFCTAAHLQAECVTCAKFVPFSPCLSSAAFPGKVTQQTYACGGGGAGAFVRFVFKIIQTIVELSHRHICVIGTDQSASTPSLSTVHFN